MKKYSKKWYLEKLEQRRHLKSRIRFLYSELKRLNWGMDDDETRTYASELIDIKEDLTLKIVRIEREIYGISENDCFIKRMWPRILLQATRWNKVFRNINK